MQGWTNYLHVDVHLPALQSLDVPSVLSLISTAAVCFLTLGLGNAPFPFSISLVPTGENVIWVTLDLKVDLTGAVSLLKPWHVLDLGTAKIRTPVLQTTPISCK